MSGNLFLNPYRQPGALFHRQAPQSRRQQFNKMMDLPVFVTHPRSRIAGWVEDAEMLQKCFVLQQARFFPIMLQVEFPPVLPSWWIVWGSHVD